MINKLLKSSVRHFAFFLAAFFILAPFISIAQVPGTVVVGSPPDTNLQVLQNSSVSQANTADSNRSLVRCGRIDINGDYRITEAEACGWSDLIILVKTVTDFLIIIGASVATIAFAYAGFLMMTASGEMSKVEKAKSIFGKVLVGFLLMLSAWIIVRAIESALVTNDKFTTLLK